VPRLIDTDSRRQGIAEAAWRLIQRAGLDAASVRGVAKEAGLSAGSLRHVFATQAELLAFAMAALGERATERLAALAPAATPLDGATDALAQLIPLDDERRREAEVWLAFVTRARVDPELRALGERTDDALRALVRLALDPLELADPDLAVEDVYALVDGLTLHAVLRPGGSPPETMRRVLRTHLERLAAQRAPARSVSPRRTGPGPG
jgi:DNA-binding transcriptional regulator YbjK